MKKVLVSLLALMAVMTVQAQSICSSWRSIQPIVETAEDGSFSAQTFTYTFNRDGSFSLVDEFTQATQPARTMALEVAMSIELKGTYTVEGNQLTLTPNMDTYKTELISISKNGRVTNDNKVKTSINAMVNSEEFKSRFAEAETVTVKVGESVLEMTKDGQTMYFARFVTLKN